MRLMNDLGYSQQMHKNIYEYMLSLFKMIKFIFKISNNFFEVLIFFGIYKSKNYQEMSVIKLENIFLY